MIEGIAGGDLLIGLVLASAALVGLAVFVLKRDRAGVAGSAVHASSDLAAPLAGLPVLIVDLETTGLDVRKDRVVSIGAVRGLGIDLKRDDPLDFLVDPDCPIPALSTSIHGITDTMVVGAPKFEEAFEKLDAMLTGRVVVGHNIGFDLATLQSECKRVGVPWSRLCALDLVRLAAALDPRERDLTLEGMADRWGITISGRHTALGDALMAAELWAYLLPRLRDAGVVTLGDALKFERRARSVIANQKRAGW